MSYSLEKELRLIEERINKKNPFTPLTETEEKTEIPTETTKKHGEIRFIKFDNEEP